MSSAKDRKAQGVTLSESDGVRYLHFGTEWVQGAMSLRHPYRLELEYQQQMMIPLLFVPKPGRVLQLGLGAAALTKFCYRHMRSSALTVVELDPDVIGAARQWFALPPDDARLAVIESDAAVHLGRAAVAGTADWLQVDLYDAQARGPVFDDPGFYRACRRALRPGGVAAFNLFGSSLQPSTAAIGTAFGRRWLRLPRSAAGNTVVLAFAEGSPQEPLCWAADDLIERAARFENRFALPARDWLHGMRSASARQICLAPGTRLCL